MSDPPKELRKNFFFKDIHPNLFIGTTSDRYAGWLGQIYTEDKYIGRITRRTTTVGGEENWVLSENAVPESPRAEIGIERCSYLTI